MIHRPLSPDLVHPEISSSLRLLVLSLVRPHLFVIHYGLFVSFIGSLEKYHTKMTQKCIYKFGWCDKSRFPGEIVEGKVA